MTTIAPKLIGRLGNQMFIYANARARAEKEGHRFVCQPWLGQEIFDLHDEAQFAEPDIWVDGYCQNQESLIYTKQDCQRWFRFKDAPPQQAYPQAHRRVGDYAALGYVVVSGSSYEKAANQFGVPLFRIVTEGCGRSWQEDFKSLTMAPILFRGNSSFSWWAGTIGNGKVYSPIIDGLEGGREQDCEFVEGNWPKFANLPNITDLHLAP